MGMGRRNYKLSQFHNHAQQQQVKKSGGPLDNQTQQTERKTVPLAKVQLCEYENLCRVCMSSSIAQRSARIVQFQLLRMIVKVLPLHKSEGNSGVARKKKDEPQEEERK